MQEQRSIGDHKSLPSRQPPPAPEAESAPAGLAGRASGPAYRVLVVAPPSLAAAVMSADGPLQCVHVDATGPMALHEVEMALRVQAPGLMLIDAALCETMDAATVQRLHGVRPACRWIVGWPAYDRRWLGALVSCDALGAVEWGSSALALRRAAEAVLNGELWFARSVLQQMYRSARGESPIWVSARALPEGSPPLTRREAEVLALVRAGLTNKAIAQQIGTSINTVKKHVARAFDKTGVHKRRQVAG
jgi:DNA-binding NarL/FixJ family response regulator